MIKLGVDLWSTAMLGGGAGGGPQTIVFVQAGQSNSMGRGDYDSGPVHPANTQQYDQTNTLVSPTNPLDHINPFSGDMGLDVQFSIDWHARNPGKNLVFIPCGEGGTSFAAGDWTHDGTDNLYDAMIARTNQLFSENPDFILGGLFWHQGESDSGNASYQSQLDAMLSAFRTDVTVATSTTPIVVGGLVHDFVTASADNAAINNIIEDTPNRIANVAVAYGQNARDFDNLHFDGAGLRLMGHRYDKVLPSAIAGVVRPRLDDAASVMTDNLEWKLPTGASLSGGVLSLQDVANNATINYNGWPLEDGRTYRITFTVSNYVSGLLRVRNPVAATPVATSNGQKTVTFTSNGVTFFGFRAEDGSDTVATMDVVIDDLEDITP